MTLDALIENPPASDDGDWVVGRLANWARTRPDAPYVQSGDSEWVTYQEMYELSRRVAAGLQSRGVEKQTRVAYLVSTRLECVVLFFALAQLGAVGAPLNTFLRGEFLRHQLADLQPGFVIADAPGVGQLRPVLPQLEGLRHLITVGEVGTADLSGIAVPVSTYEALAEESAEVVLPQVTPSDICLILYTGGTTGSPKGCLIPHSYVAGCLIPHSYVAALAESLTSSGWARPGDRVITTYPFFHMGAMYAICNPLWVGASLVYEQEFHASTAIARARETGATVMYGMGAMAMAIMAQPERPDDADNDLRLAFFIPLTPESQLRFERRFGTAVTCELYGQTECVPVTVNAVDGDRLRSSAGRVLPNFEVALLDDEDRQVPVGTVGEIGVRPLRPGVMFAGYWNNAEATMQTWRNLWHHTGDFGWMDENGFLHFVDRKKDALRRRGEFVSTLELEQAIRTSPDVAEVSVHAVPSELTEDDIKACIGLQPGRPATPESLFAFFRENLPYYAIPRYVEIFDELPATSATRRVQKHELAARSFTENTWDFERLGLSVPRDQRRA